MQRYVLYLIISALWHQHFVGIDVHSLAEPTKLAFLKQEFEKQKAEAKDETRQKLAEKYGGEVSKNHMHIMMTSW